MTWEWPMSGSDSFVMFNLVSDNPDFAEQGHYDFVDSSPDTGKINGVTTSTETDFASFKPKVGSRVFVPIGGFCKIGIFDEEFLDMQWSMNSEEYIYEGELLPTGNTRMVSGAYSGNLTRFDFGLPEYR